MTIVRLSTKLFAALGFAFGLVLFIAFSMFSNTSQPLDTQHPEFFLAREEDRLIEIFKRHGSAKVGEFMDVYPPIFAPYSSQQNSPASKYAMLEIGNNRGDTFQAYLEMFPKGDVYGLDIDIPGTPYHELKVYDLGKQFDHAHMYTGKQTDTNLLEEIGNQAIRRNRGFDVVIDDGSHVIGHQIKSLVHLWPFVKPGGYYVVEDIETSYYKEGYGGGDLKKPGTFVALAKDIADVLQRDYHRGPNKPRRGAGNFTRFPGDEEVLSIQFFTNACVIRKAKDAKSPTPLAFKNVEIDYLLV